MAARLAAETARGRSREATRSRIKKEVHAMKLTAERCFDILDWFDDPILEFLYHNLIAKSDGDKRIERVLPHLIERASALLAEHANTESAYPAELWNQPG
jgi:hypothetical protein